MQNKQVGLVLAVLVAALAIGRPALPEQREKASDRKVTEALQTALRVAKAEGRSFDPERQTITIRRKGRSWSFHFVLLPLPNGRVLPDSSYTVGVQDDGQVNFIPAL